MTVELCASYHARLGQMAASRVRFVDQIETTTFWIESARLAGCRRGSALAPGVADRFPVIPSGSESPKGLPSKPALSTIQYLGGRPIGLLELTHDRSSTGPGIDGRILFARARSVSE